MNRASGVTLALLVLACGGGAEPAPELREGRYEVVSMGLARDRSTEGEVCLRERDLSWQLEDCADPDRWRLRLRTVLARERPDGLWSWSGTCSYIRFESSARWDGDVLTIERTQVAADDLPGSSASDCERRYGLPFDRAVSVDRDRIVLRRIGD